MEFHDATSDDLPDLARMNQQLIRDEGSRNPMSLAQLEERMRGWIAGDYQAVMFGKENEPYGYILCRRDPEWVYVRQLWVDARYRRRGIGRAVMSWMIENRWAGAPRIRLDVLIHNASGLAFWRSLGFTDHAVTLERELTQ